MTPHSSPDVKSIFGRALEIEDAERRAAYLAEACADAPTVRAEVEELLDMHDHAGGFLHRPAGLTPDRTGAYESPAPLVGTVIAGRYKLLEEIGDGGMGTVWMAEQREPIKRLVAVKLIKAGMDSKAVLSRFEAERQALALMDHPNIAKVFDAGTDENGRPHFVMELVKGLPLTEYCDARKLSVNERLDLFVQICSAVQHAHQKAVIHRDLKPTNVLVTEHDGKPVPKVIDFGLAKALNSSQMLTERTLHTAYGTVVGTPLYMAPEQVGINALDVDTRTDIYALGVILYELLTGTTPLEKAKFKEAAWEEVKRLIREEEPPRPSTRLSSDKTLPSLAASRQVDAAQLHRLVRGELDWIVMKALDKDRSRRYETANALAKDVQRHLAGETVEACPPTLGYRLRKAYRRNRAAVLIGGAFAWVLLIATGVSLTLSSKAKQAQYLADLSATAAVKNEDIAQDRLRQLSEAFATIKAGQSKQLGLEYARSIQFADTALHANKFDVARKILDGASPERRGWEWHYLNHLWRSDYLLDIRPHRTIVKSALYSPDGKQIVTASATATNSEWMGTVEVWDADTGLLLFMLEDNVPKLSSAQFNQDGTKLLTVQDSVVKLWNLATREAEWQIHPDVGMIFASAALSPNGKQIVARTRGIRDSTPNWIHKWSVTVWDVQLKKPLWPAHRWENERVSIPSFSTDGKWVVASVSTRNKQSGAQQTNAFWQHTDVLIWDAATGKVVGQLQTPTPAGTRLNTAIFSPKANRIITCDLEGRALIWPMKQMDEQLVRDGDPMVLPGRAVEAVISPDGTRIAVMEGWLDRARVQIRDVATGVELRTLRGHQDSLWSVAFSPDGSRIVTAGTDGTVKTWDAKASDTSRILSPSNISYVSFSPRGNQLLTCNNSETKVWDTRTRKELSPPLRGGIRGYHQHSRFSPDGRWIATIEGKTVRIYDARTYKLRHTLQERTGDVYLTSFNPDGTQLLVANDHSTVTVWDVEKGEELERISTASRLRGYSQAAFSPTGELFLVEHLGKDPRTMSGITLYDAHTRKPKSKLNTGIIGYYTWNGTFSGDGKRFVGYFMFKDKPNECLVWNVDTGELEFSFQTHSSNNATMALSPDGKRLLTIGDNRSVKVWDVGSGVELLTIPSEFQVNSIAFHPDGTKFAIDHSWAEALIFDGTPLPEPKK